MGSYSFGNSETPCVPARVRFRSTALRRGKFVSFGFVLLGLVGCGYHFGPKGSPLWGEVSTVSVPLMMNRTTETGLEHFLTSSVRKELASRGGFDVVASPSADAVVEGEVLGIRTMPVAYTRDFLAARYRIRIELGIVVKKRGGKILWEENLALDSNPYIAHADVMVTEDNREEALRRLAGEVAIALTDLLLMTF